MPLQAQPFIVVVAPAGERVQPSDLRAFITDGRGGPGNNCDVLPIGDGCGVLLELPPQHAP